jgi:tRNA(Ile)-lysidine synthase
MPADRPISRGSDVRLVRPLLTWSRADVEALARAEGWAWREDATNAGTTYRRNALRNEVMPVLRRIFGEDVSGRIAASAARVGAWAGAPGLLLDALEALGPGLPLASLRALPAEVRQGLYLAALERHAPAAPRNAALAASIDGLVDAQTGRRVEVGPAVVWRDRERLVFEIPEPPAGPVAVAAAGETATPWGALVVEPLAEAPAAFGDDPFDVAVDAEALAAPLELRPWAAGDAIEPLGGPGHRLVSDILTDARVPAAERAARLVLTAAGRILWIVGHRLDARAAARAGRPAARVQWTPLRGQELKPDAPSPPRGRGSA